MNKKCKRCKSWKDVSHYGKHTIMKDGLRSICKECNNSLRNEYHKENRDVELSKFRQLYQKNREDRLLYRKKYRRERLDTEKAREYGAQYRAKNKDKIRASMAAWKIAKAVLYVERRVLRVSGTFANKKYRAQICEIYRNRPKGFHVDHIIPLKAKNLDGEWVACGLHVPWNLQYLPAQENLRKQSKIPEKEEMPLPFGSLGVKS